MHHHPQKQHFYRMHAACVFGWNFVAYHLTKDSWKQLYTSNHCKPESMIRTMIDLMTPWLAGVACFDELKKIILIKRSSLEPFHQGLHASAFLKLCGGILRVILLTADKPKHQPRQMQKDSVFCIDLWAHLGAFDTQCHHCHTGP